jgi:N-methylhydantoinase A
VGVDIGGTFTDAVVLDGDGRVTVAKTRTTPEAIASGFLDALAVLAERAGTRPEAVAYLAHGTTIATNAIVQARTARVALVTTAGFRDTLEIGTQLRAHLYDLRAPNPPPLVERALRFEVDERIGPGGEVVRPLDEAALEVVAGEIRAAGAEAIAVAFLFSFLNPSHERRAAALLAERTGLEVTRSSQVAPELREYPRTSTTAINAALLPLVGGYVRDLAGRLDDAGVRAPLHLMRSSGGVARAADAAALPVGLISSGPAAGRSPGSTRSGRSPSAPSRRVPIRGRRPTRSAARTRPSPTPTWCSARSTPRGSWAGGRHSTRASPGPPWSAPWPTRSASVPRRRRRRSCASAARTWRPRCA